MRNSRHKFFSGKSLLILVLQLFMAPAAFGVILDGGAISGIMVQPTSNYYHMIYGGYLGTSTEMEGVGFQGGYIERPAFKAAGFVDKEWSSYFLLGSKVTDAKIKKAGVWAGFGVSRVGGFIGPSDGNPDLPKRGFAIDGVGAALECYARVLGVRLSIAHQTFVGFANDIQTSAYVAWPYSFVMIKVGTFY